MLFYVLTRQDTSKVPFELYKDNAVVVYWLGNEINAETGNGFVSYAISFDYKDDTHTIYSQITLFNLTDADLTHLKLLGINPTAMDIPTLRTAIENGESKFLLPRVIDRTDEEQD